MISPFTSRLGTNYCPPDDEISQIKALLVEPSLRLKRLDEEIAVLQQERDFLAASIGAHQALLSPIRQLPLDLIQEIFVACLPTHRNCVMSTMEAPVLLGRICSSWRTISLTTPRLWTRLHVVEPSQHWIDAKVVQRVEVLKMWFGRSGVLPLSISIHCTTRDFLRTLLPFAARWQHIQFLNVPDSLEPLSHITEVDVPMLKSFAIPFLTQANWALLAIFRGPRISGFTASAGDFATGNLPLRWHQLTTLQMRGFPSGDSMTSQKILQMLSRCPQLRVCELVFHDSDSTPHSPVELKFLHSLDLVPSGVDAAVTFLLDRLLLPELRNFTLRTPNADGQHNPPPLFHYIALWDKLESLEIETSSFSISSWPQAIRSLPATLRQLVIHDTRVGPPIETALTILTRPPEIPAQCPVLEELHITCSRLLLEAALLRFIAARMRGASPSALRSVEVAFDLEMEVDILPDLQPFIGAGLHVSLTYKPSSQRQWSPWSGLPDDPNPKVLW
ncbi:hypothetical protein C8F04DRAFT_1078021 [Mycena alexandri]|uniref:F-box domain-containing protein n=1 Tax=Mycena alexandri TaxID=1745969 RepID=A0AAD6TDL6_9AGAR|nr:hypothetical protein C8F04DRAFT_1078021 [Mycena alexandri]